MCGWRARNQTLSSIARTLRFRFKGYIPKLEERLIEEGGTFETARWPCVTIEVGLCFTNHWFKAIVGMTGMFSPHRAITVPQLRSVLKSPGGTRRGSLVHLFKGAKLNRQIGELQDILR